MSLVIASRAGTGPRLPERVATTDLFHDVAHEAEATGARFFMLGGARDVVRQAAEKVRATYPKLDLVGFRDGYFQSYEEECEAAAAIDAMRPDVLWIGMGAPRELEFAMQHRARLSHVGVIKTSGGLFDFLAGAQPRAPLWMQSAGLEWAYRLSREPRRLLHRYATTTPHAVYLLLRGRSSNA
jgi:N-acetylglucosaminyldiphosphoundecaprenol N-acetyl-beta-D-mannosaminyltransferase